MMVHRRPGSVIWSAIFAFVIGTWMAALGFGAGIRILYGGTEGVLDFASGVTAIVLFAMVIGAPVCFFVVVPILLILRNTSLGGPLPVVGTAILPVIAAMLWDPGFGALVLWFVACICGFYVWFAYFGMFAEQHVIDERRNSAEP